MSFAREWSIFFVSIMLLQGCVKRNASRGHVSLVGQQEAMLVDVPIPLHDGQLSIQQDDSNTEDVTILSYRSFLAVDAIIDFYRYQMERLGWQQMKIFRGAESLIQFESPERLCSVSVRSSSIKSKNKMKNDITIFVGKKESIIT